MKNKKIVALLCAMAMIITTLSSLLTVSAAAGLKVSMDISGEKNEDGNYTVTVKYSGNESKAPFGAVDVAIPIPEDLTFVAKDKDIKIKSGYNKARKAFVISDASTDALFEDEAGILAIFYVKPAEGSTNTGFELKFDEESFLTDIGGGAGNNVNYTISDTEHPLLASGDSVEYDREKIPGVPYIYLEKLKNDDGTYTISVKYDIKEIEGKAVNAIDIVIPIPDGSFVEKDKDIKIKSGYNKAKKAFAISDADTEPLVEETEGTLARFTINVTEVTKIALSEIIIGTSSEDGTKDTFTTETGNINWGKALKIDPNEEEPVVTEPPVVTDAPVETPTQAPGDETPAPVATPEPSDVEIVVGDYTNSSLLQNNKAVSVTVTDIVNPDKITSGKIDIVIQGTTTSGKKEIPCGNVIIPGIDITNTNLLNVPFTGYVAGATKVVVNVYDSQTGTVLAERVVK